MNGIPSSGDDVALFIDWENFKISLASGHRTPNVSALKEEVGNHGRVVVAKAYADWVSRAPELRGASQFTNDPPALYAAGIEPVYVPTRLPPVGAVDSYRTARIKNSVDVKMTADCIECAHSYSNIGTYVLVSGDSDFIHVINTLRAMGKKVIIIGVSWSTSRRLADQVDGLILYDTDVDPVAPAEVAPAPNGGGNGRAAPTGRQQLSEAIGIIEDIIRAERQAGRMPLLTSLKQRVMRRIPGFDEKKLGFSGFKKLMQRVAQEGNIKLVTVGLVDWVLMSDEPDPQEPAVDTPGTGSAPGAVTVVDTEGDGAELAVSSQALEPKPTPKNGREGQGRRSSKPVARSSAPSAQPDLGPLLSMELAEELADVHLPEGPGDGLDAYRVADLIVMANTLEHREGISHVAFNFLVEEICGALNDGLKAESEEIAQRWGQTHSRIYVTRLIRSLSDAGVFQRGWHSDRDEDSGRTRRRRTFNLDQDHPLVVKVLQSHSEIPEPDPESSAAALSEVESSSLPVLELEEGEIPQPTEPEATDPSSSLGKVLRFFSRS